MPSQTRTTIPAKIRERVLAEFNHRCAICGKDKPHLHHIDENPQNNTETNLIPLCPNCHLLDQHSPTKPFNSRKLELFRRFKDPVILSSEFEPLFQRFTYLFDVEDSTYAATTNNGQELVAFVSALAMGIYYGSAIGQCVIPAPLVQIWGVNTTEAEFAEMDKERWKHLVEHLLKSRDKAVNLCIELLRYQGWKLN